MGCGATKRYKKRYQEIYSDPNKDLFSNSISEELYSRKTEKNQLNETCLVETTSATQKHYCHNCGNKMRPSDIFCANCGVQV
ncbi:MAG: hypothetical protein HeimC3_33980 [Candidatus Heimdallarchaeota archaeon LC_3]|nr:MAG: hypothetical protein HeimC3_33980 [Candidatus Heimdallarchaeota archaeon LC_3]